MRLHFVPDPSKDMSRALLNPHHTHQLNIPIPRHPRGAGFFDKDSFPSIGPSLVHTHTQMPFLLQWPSVYPLLMQQLLHGWSLMQSMVLMPGQGTGVDDASAPPITRVCL